MKHIQIISTLILGVILSASSCSETATNISESISSIVDEVFEESYDNYLYPIVDADGKYGCINIKGEIIIPPQYEGVWEFNDNGFAEFKKNGKYGFLNLKGEVVVEPIYDFFTTYISEYEIFKIQQNEKYGILDKNGKMIVPPIYDIIYFEYGIIVKRNNKYGIIDSKGNEIVPMQYDYISRDIGDDLIAVEKNGKYGYIDIKGNVVIPCQFEDCSSFSEGLAPVCIGEHWGYINKKGIFEIAPSFENCETNRWFTNCHYPDKFHDGMAAIRLGSCISNQWPIYIKRDEPKYIDKSGNYITDIEFKCGSDFVDGYAIVGVDNRDKVNGYIWAEMDKKGNLNYQKFAGIEYIEIHFGSKQDDKIIKFSKNGKVGLMKRNGKIVIDAQYDHIGGFYDDIAVTINDEKEGLIDSKGNVIVAPQFDDINSFHDGLAVIKINELYGFINTKGKIVINPIYKHAKKFCHGLALVEIDDNIVGYINKKGEIIYKMQISYNN